MSYLNRLYFHLFQCKDITNFAVRKINLNVMINMKESNNFFVYFSTSLREAWNNLVTDQIDLYKKGSKIHIKKENRGKFTAAAKRAGMGVQEYASKVLRDPNASP